MKKITIVLSVAVLALLCVFSSCQFGCIKGSGNANTETRNLGNFKRIEIQGGFKVHLKQDSSMDVKVTADDNLMKYIRTSISNGTLHIYSKKSLCSKTDMAINIGVGQLQLIRAEGAIELTGEGKLNVQNIKFDLSGANRITLDLDAANIKTDASGANELHLSGQAASHTIDMSGSGKVFAFDMPTGDYSIETAGASHCEINVLKTLKINTTGASDVQYKGSPSTIQNQKSGASKVTKVD
ncbi:head GIN domain-containing protein [Mucilaginibacter agri]|uniref:Putative auto-transporter adhesin head GIN domain-containing protein n=1 Tax=Mucilaginibacter agri TaxID=2695265 RepID=A0A965ZGS3_9SPHI|nr:head GIN domain-containing protein [Mucilaginibacter agri]NCD69868.1 hypothetical protein [Mucilaginibacter agri]